MAPKMTEPVAWVVVRSVVYNGDRVKDVAARVGFGTSALYNVLKNYKNDLPLVAPRWSRAGQGTALRAEEVDWLVDVVLKKEKRLYLKEMCTRLRDEFGVNVDESTVSRALKKRKVTNKQIAAIAFEADMREVALFMMRSAAYKRDQLVFSDESTLHENRRQRTRGWAPSTERAQALTFSIRGVKYSFVPAVWWGGTLSFSVTKGSFTKETYYKWFEDDVLPKMRPFPEPCSVYVADNCSAHDMRLLEEMLASKGARLLRTPVYYSMFQVTEELHQAVKKVVRDKFSDHAIPSYQAIIQAAWEALTPARIQSAIEHCGWARR